MSAPSPPLRRFHELGVEAADRDAAKIAARRARNEARVAVFMDARKRTTGQDFDTLAAQVAEKKRLAAVEREEEREQLQLTNKKILEHLKQALGEYVPNYSAPKLRGLASPRNFSLHWGFGTPLEVLDDVELLTRMVQLKQTAREPQESGTSTTFEHPRASGSDAAIASPSSLVSAAGAAAVEHRDGQPLSIAANRCQTPLRTPPARRAPQLEPTVPGGNLMPRKPERPSTAPLSLRSPRAASPAPAAPQAAGSNSAIAAAPSPYLDVAGLTSRDDSVRQRLAEIRAQQQKEQAAVATKLAQRAEEAGRVVEATYESLCKEAQGRVAKWAGKRMQVTKRVSDAAARREAETLSELQRKTERVEAWRQEQEVVARQRAEALAKERAEAAMRFGERLQAREERLQKAEESAQRTFHDDVAPAAPRRDRAHHRGRRRAGCGLLCPSPPDARAPDDAPGCLPGHREARKAQKGAKWRHR